MKKKAARTKIWFTKYNWLTLILAVVVVLRIPSLYEPYWYGDEAIYLTIGQALGKGVGLYSQIHDNKPPLLYLMAAIGGGHLFWFKFLALIWSLITVTIFYKLTEKLGGKRLSMVLSTFVFALLTTLPKLEGNIANAELFFLLPTIMATLVLWDKDLSFKKVYAGGVLIGIGTLFKMPAVIEAGVWPLIWLMFPEKGWWKKTITLFLGVITPLAVSVLWFLFFGGLKEYLIAAWAQNLPYLSSWGNGNTEGGILSLKGRIVIFIMLLAPVAGFSRRLGKKTTLITMWAYVTIFASLLSGRPYPHYLLQSAGVISLAAGELIFGLSVARIWALIVFTIFGLSIWTYKFYNYPVWDYYKNFLSWAWGKENKEKYFSWFDPQVNKNYKISSIVKGLSFPEDKIFVWGDHPSVYALSERSPAGKYTVKYHIKDFEAEDYELKTIITTRPRIIVSYGQEDELPGLESILENNYRLETIVDGVKIYTLSD